MFLLIFILVVYVFIGLIRLCVLQDFYSTLTLQEALGQTVLWPLFFIKWLGGALLHGLKELWR